MNSTSKSFAIYGAEPEFENPVAVGQLYFPSWQRYERAMRGIFDRQYYANNGPLQTELEAKLQAFLGVKHVVCVTNGTFGLIMAAQALGLTGKVILPSFTFVASAQSLIWAGIEPVFCDVDPETHQLDITQLDSLIDDDVTAIMGVNLWGGASKVVELEEYAKRRGLKLYFDSAHAFGCEVNNKKISGFGSLEVFSFHATKILSATEGGCVCTNDDQIAARLRSIRPSYDKLPGAEIAKVANARMSEAQAAIALLSLEDFPKNQKNNETIFKCYRERVGNIAGIKLVEPNGISFSNYQYVVCEVDESQFGLSRDQLIKVLEAENILARRYFYPGTHRIAELDKYAENSCLPVTDKLCASCIQLPIGAPVDVKSVSRICQIIHEAQLESVSLRHFFDQGSL